MIFYKRHVNIFSNSVKVEKENRNKIKEIRKNSATMFHFLDKEKLLDFLDLRIGIASTQVATINLDKTSKKQAKN